MTNTEPQWPARITADSTWALGFNQAVEDCKDAWTKANDDPSKSLVGEIREHLGRPVIRVAHAVGLDREPPHYPWTLIADYEDGRSAGMTHANVTGCRVIGTIPGTPAREKAEECPF